MKQVEDQEQEIRAILARMDDTREYDPNEPEETVHAYSLGNGRWAFSHEEIVFVDEPDTQQDTWVVEALPVSGPLRSSGKSASLMPAYILLSCYALLILSVLVFQLWWLLSPPQATITLVSSAERHTLSGTLQLGHVTSPLELAQSLRVPATGHGHQDAQAATGTLVFTNSSFTSPQSFPAGTLFTGSDGVQVQTTQDVTIPAASASSFSYAKVSAQVTHAGSQGNIAAGDMVQVYSSSVRLTNPLPFTGGQDERNYQVVTRGDITHAASSLLPSVERSMHAALNGQITGDEQAILLPCHPVTHTDYSVGTITTQVQVRVSLTCQGVIYDPSQVQAQAEHFLDRKIHAGETLLGTMDVAVVSASLPSPTHPLLHFTAQGIWGYTMSTGEKRVVVQKLAGMSKEQAATYLASLPHVNQVSISWFESMTLPKRSSDIHLTYIYLDM